MIISMAVDNGGSNSQAFSLLNTSTAASSQEECSFNFLKRKHNTAEDICNTNQEINNPNGNGNENLSTHYQGSNELGNSAWKKRHIEAIATTTTTVMTTTPTTAISTSNATTLNPNATTLNPNATTLNPNANTFNLNNNNFNNNNQIVDYNNTNNILTTTNNNNNHIITNNNNDVTFNLITSSAFINDFFEYDASSLIVPVSIAPVNGNATNINNQQLSSINNNNNIITSNVQPTNVYVDSTEWQSTDLLELDHRYNSGLQTEISQLTPTINLRETINTTAAINQLPSSNTSTTNQLIHTTNPTTTPVHFLVPQKQVSQQQRFPTTPLNKYRSVQNLTQLEHPQQAPPHKPDNDTDFEDKNLSWLLNFKFDDLPHLSPDISANNANLTNNSNSKTGAAAIQNSNLSSLSSQRDRSRSPKTSSSSLTTTKTGKKFEELVMEVTAELDGSEMIVAENVVVEDTPLKTIKKPPFTYTELIEYALEDKGELTVSGIYQWISDRFPFYKSNDDRWKNSVRHNLSINPHFRKGVKAPQGAGHLWTISSGDSAENVLAWEHKKQRLELFFKMESMNRERLQQHQQQQLQHQQQQHQHNEQCPSPHNHQGCQAGQCLYEEAAKAAATISQEMLQSTTQRTDEAPTTINNNNHNEQQHHHRLSHAQIMHELPFNDLMSDEELRKTAGQILNGIHREVEVQSMNSIISTYHDVLLDNEDYLNPIQKDVAVHESGLRHSNSNHITSSSTTHHTHNNASQYYITEIDPLALDIQMSHQVHETEEVLFNDDFNLSYFAYNAGNDIVA